jgi:hypothetical protein
LLAIHSEFLFSLDVLQVTIHALTITTLVTFEQFPCFCVFGCIPFESESSFAKSLKFHKKRHYYQLHLLIHIEPTLKLFKFCNMLFWSIKYRCSLLLGTRSHLRYIRGFVLAHLFLWLVIPTCLSRVITLWYLSHFIRQPWADQFWIFKASSGLRLNVLCYVVQSAWTKGDMPRRGDTPVLEYATREDLMMVLENLEYIYVRSHYDSSMALTRFDIRTARNHCGT